MEDGGRVRSFVCLELPSAIRRFFGDVIARLRQDKLPFRWGRTEGLHITLAFCGEHPASTVARFTRALGEELEGAPLRPFPLRLVGLNGFPRRINARVLVAEVEERSGVLNALADRVGRLALQEELIEERPRFTPHVTLGRAREGATVPEAPWFAASTALWTADSVTYMRSDLRPSGPLYSAMGRWLLKEDGAVRRETL
jgi:2'-5' RNA ligase